MKTSFLRSVNITYIPLFAIIIAVCSWISIPTVVPFSLQTFGVFLTVSILGGKRGTLSVLIYLLLGIVGIPVFTGFRGGIGVVLGNTGGYMVGFLLSALVMWGLEKIIGRKPVALGFSMILGLLICYAFGTIWFMIVFSGNVSETGWWTILGWCVFPFILPDLLKIGLVLTLNKRLQRIIFSKKTVQL